MENTQVRVTIKCLFNATLDLRNQPTGIANATRRIPSIATGAHAATTWLSSGPEIKNPLPIIVASGVTVARQREALRTLGRNKTTSTASATPGKRRLDINLPYSLAVRPIGVDERISRK
ncbi:MULTISPECIES: hypothetical protein [Kangiella]|uniref:hypothetical protein n=1 Tax=Kangiella TaxID=261963 RepID=UPI0018E2FF27|nr:MULTISPECIES: hypothetical protein [Kangiella]MBD3653941.1 hypothetical protein [Kangiella sp.]